MDEYEKNSAMIAYMRDGVADVVRALDNAESAHRIGCPGQIDDGKMRSSITGQIATADGHMQIARDIMDRLIHNAHVTSKVMAEIRGIERQREFYSEYLSVPLPDVENWG